jgi:prolyl-tRNA editing enzyme YbaK/EbsC (Cys-tRNA(Pro) deacylase)
MAITGYPVGAVPPFGHPHPLQTLIYAGVLDQAVVYGGGGETDALMRLRSKELQHATRGRIVSVSEE